MWREYHNQTAPQATAERQAQRRPEDIRAFAEVF
jgi:hypothetical protein